jgi:Flp pilus assembly protein TadG
VRQVRFWRDTRGTTAVEFGLTAAPFFLLLVGVLLCGLLLWARVGLQHGAEAAARCATVNKSLCGDAAAITNYAAQNAFGLNPPASAFTYTAATCGNSVSASYPFPFAMFFGVTELRLSTQACFPK